MEKMLMRKRIYWGLVALFILIGITGVTLFILREAERVEKAKFVEKIKADYEILKKKHGIAGKIAALNRQMGDIGIVSEDGELLPGNFSSDQINELIRQRNELRKLKRQFYAEFNRLPEVQNSKQLDAWVQVCSARDDYLEANDNVLQLKLYKNQLQIYKNNVESTLK